VRFFLQWHAVRPSRRGLPDTRAAATPSGCDQVVGDRRRAFAPGSYASRSGCAESYPPRAECVKFDTDVVGDLDLSTLGATYSFGGSAY